MIAHAVLALHMLAVPVSQRCDGQGDGSSECARQQLHRDLDDIDRDAETRAELGGDHRRYDHRERR